MKARNILGAAAIGAYVAACSKGAVWPPKLGPVMPSPLQACHSDADCHPIVSAQGPTVYRVCRQIAAYAPDGGYRPNYCVADSDSDDDISNGGNAPPIRGPFD